MMMTSFLVLAVLTAAIQVAGFALPRPQIGVPGAGAAVGTTAGAGAVTGVGVGVPAVVVTPPSIPAVPSSSTRSSTTSQPSSVASSGSNAVSSVAPGTASAASTAAAPSAPQAIPPAPPTVAAPSSALAGVSTPGTIVSVALASTSLAAASSPSTALPSAAAPTNALVDGLSSLLGMISSVLGAAPSASSQPTISSAGPSQLPSVSLLVSSLPSGPSQALALLRSSPIAPSLLTAPSPGTSTPVLLLEVPSPSPTSPSADITAPQLSATPAGQTSVASIEAPSVASVPSQVPTLETQSIPSRAAATDTGLLGPLPTGTSIGQLAFLTSSLSVVDSSPPSAPAIDQSSLNTANLEPSFSQPELPTIELSSRSAVASVLAISTPPFPTGVAQPDITPSALSQPELGIPSLSAAALSLSSLEVSAVVVTSAPSGPALSVSEPQVDSLAFSPPSLSSIGVSAVPSGGVSTGLPGLSVQALQSDILVPTASASPLEPSLFSAGDLPTVSHASNGEIPTISASEVSVSEIISNTALSGPDAAISTPKVDSLNPFAPLPPALSALVTTESLLSPTLSAETTPVLSGRIPTSPAASLPDPATVPTLLAPTGPVTPQMSGVSLASEVPSASTPQGLAALSSLDASLPSSLAQAPDSVTLSTVDLPTLAANVASVSPSDANPQAPALTTPDVPAPSIAPPSLSPSAPSVPSLQRQTASSSRSYMQVTMPTTVALTNTAALISLGALPANSDASGLPTAQPANPALGSNVVSAPSNPTMPDASAAASHVPSAVSTPSIASALDDIGVGLVQSLANAMVQLMSLLENTRQPVAAAAQDASSAESSDAVPSLQSSLSNIFPMPSPASLDTEILTTAAPTLTSPLASESQESSTSSFVDPNKRKRALPGLQSLAAAPALSPLPIIPGAALPGVNNLPIGAQVQTPSVTAAAAASLQPSPAAPSTAPGLPSALSTASLPPVSAPSLPVASGLPSAGLPSLGQVLPSTQILPSQYYEAISGAPIIGSTTLPVAAGSTVLSVVTSIPLPDDLPALMQGVKNAAVANITEAVTNVPLIGQAEQVLAVLQLLAIMNIGQFGSLATLTNLPAVQSAVSVINEPDLITVVNVLGSKSIVYSTAADGLLSNVIGFVQMVETLLPLVSNLKAAVSYVILDQLGLTTARDVLDGTLISSLPGGGGGV